MKKAILLLLFSGIALTLASLEKKDFDRIVDFSLDIKGISKIVQAPGFNPAAHGRAVIFDGSVAGILVFNPDPAEFMAEIEVAGGEWEGLENVSLFRVFVYVLGPDFAGRLETPDSGSAARADAITMNCRLLIAGSLDSVYTDEADGKNYAIILAHYIRVIP
ncbi:MAG: hypothetical protein LBQ57_04835 [Spirochaetales bacterium]|jgi:hypothetical protein|nr:hypothetical protein [Spirochaetales bacterium]